MCHTRVDPDSDLAAFLENANLWVTFLFLGECILKVIAFQFITGETSYLSNAWNRLDFFIVVISVLQAIT